jgi:tetratricopeptide (TPR) repeat protein
MIADVHGDARNLPGSWQPPQPSFWRLLWQAGVVRYLLGGVPAVLAFTVVVFLAGAAASTDMAKMRTHYFEEAVRYFHARNFAGARAGFERIAEWDGPEGDPQVRYNLAVCLKDLGQHDRAVALLEPLAPDDRPGYGLAHLWKARRIWVEKGTKATPADARAGEQQVLLALEATPNDVEANALLGTYYLQTDKVEQAIPYLVKAAKSRPELLLPLARACQSRGESEVARVRAREARRIFQERAEANLNDRESRFLWAEADLILEEFPEAVKVLEREAGLKRDLDYPRALALVYFAWYNFKARTEPANWGDRLQLLERGLTFDPGNVGLLIHFSEQLAAGGADADRARAALLDLQARGIALGPVRYSLGVDAWLHGRPAEARLLLEEAYRLMPEVPLLANNLASLLAEGDKPDLPRALAMINPVLERLPDHPIYRETRGEILLKMQRWKEALPDLQAALRLKYNSPELHRNLAETYEHLDAPGLAAEHRKRAEALAAPRPATPTTQPGTAPAQEKPAR